MIIGLQCSSRQKAAGLPNNLSKCAMLNVIGRIVCVRNVITTLERKVVVVEDK